jgi:hypothetical protein
MAQSFTCIKQGLALFPEAAAHLDGAVIPEKTADLTGNFGDGVGGKLRSICEVKSLYSLDKTNTSQLVEVVCIHAAAAVSLDDAPDKPHIFRQHLLTGVIVTILRPIQQRQQLAHRFAGTREAIRLRMVTVVPLPGADFTAS